MGAGFFDGGYVEKWPQKRPHIMPILDIWLLVMMKLIL